MIAKATGFTHTLYDNTWGIRIGNHEAAGHTVGDFDGHMDEVRLTIGTARYASDAGFAVPTGPFPDR